MLQLKNINKKYVTGELVQTALNDVSINFRDQEFVSILGPSGSGKTTLLNIVGGLDRYDSGNLIINGISTSKYKDKDWDSYRNHSVGFVFQSYNLIPHQSVLSNVELALTIGGISKKERREKALKALDAVGLKDQAHKRPNQMSGGQMQRVAIARALVNDPAILLADEPTGALDTETAVTVMNLLKEVSKDRLVVLVTHNPELAEEYSTRIIKLRDGKTISDSNPYEVEDSAKEPESKSMGKSSMSFSTSLALSFNNLRSKKKRTILTSFAGSIGIIGIALILAISTGANNYINDIQKSTMTQYPISITSQGMDIASIMTKGEEETKALMEADHELDAVYGNDYSVTMSAETMSSIRTNNLGRFKEYLENNEELQQYLGENGIVYSYDTDFTLFTEDPTGELINTNMMTYGMDELYRFSNPSQGMGFSMSIGTVTSELTELIPGSDGELISQSVLDSYEVVSGSWPTSYNEIVLVLNSMNEISREDLYYIGILPREEFKEITDALMDGDEIDIEPVRFDYEELVGKTYYLGVPSSFFVDNGDGTYRQMTDDEIREASTQGLEITISGIVRPSSDSPAVTITTPLAYTNALTNHIIEEVNDSPVIVAQQSNPEINVLNGLSFETSSDSEKAEQVALFIDNMSVQDRANLFRTMISSYGGLTEEIQEQLTSLSDDEMSAMLDQVLTQASEEELVGMYDMLVGSSSYEDNMKVFGMVNVNSPSAINIYVDTFENKDKISEIIEEYNATQDEENQILYTDFIKILLSSVTTIIDVISYVLIAFVSVSLVVSSIMIGIITYISVLERTKEIGILRAIGASKRNISQVFNAETFIIGLLSGVIGVVSTWLLCIPINAIVHSIADTNDVNATLSPIASIILIALSVVLTLIGGFIPSKGAAKKDPVVALRTE